MNIKKRAILIVAILALCSSCSHMFTAKWPPTVDPLKDWSSWNSIDEETHRTTHTPIAKEITDDYQTYLGKDEPGYGAMEVLFYEDGTGQHAVRVQTYTRDRDSYYYIFIYD